MYLKNLTVLGFKSFADKTSLNFQPGSRPLSAPMGVVSPMSRTLYVGYWASNRPKPCAAAKWPM